MEYMDFVNTILDFLKLFPDVALNAFGIFIIVSFLKGSGLVKGGNMARLSNLGVAYLFNGGQLPAGGPQTEVFAATMFFAAVYWEIWEKWLAPYAKKGFALLSKNLPSR
jgi:hypothetical protein